MTLTTNQKLCFGCGEMKRLYGKFQRIGGKKNLCKTCFSEREELRLARKRNKPTDNPNYKKILKEQEGKCKICGATEKDDGRKLAIDHDHNTGKTRGILCTRCNMGIGYFRDDIHLLKSAVLYLKEHSP